MSTIIINSFILGAAIPTVTLSNASSTSEETDPADSYSIFRFNADGTIDKAEGTSASYSYVADWCDNPAAGVGSDFEIKYTTVTGVPTSPVTDLTTSFQTLSSDLRIGNRDQSAIGPTLSWSGTIEIRQITNTSNTDSATFSTSAHVV